MSEENIEVTLALVAALSDGDYDGAAEHLHPSAEWHNTAVFPGPRVVLGAPAIRDFWEDMFEAYSASAENSGMKVEELAEVDDKVIVLMHGWGHGAGSRIPFDTRWAHVLEVGDSKVLKVQTYGDYDKALEAAGFVGG
jgi:ketosteroid isomerase-like protein